jgi:predicted Zn-dependent protease
MSTPSDPLKVWTAQYSDGKTAASVMADVRLTERGIEIAFPGATQPLVWPYGALSVGSPLHRHSGDALVSYSYMPGASLYVADEGFARGLAKLAPHLTSRSVTWRAARPWIAVAVLVVIAGIVLGLVNISPSRAIARLMPDSVRTAIGKQVIQSLAANHKSCTASAGVAALDALTERLASASGVSRPFKVEVVDWNLLNAFAAPGEQIVLTRRIISEAKGPDEIAGVLAHEMGHGINLHPESSLVRVVGLSAAIELMMGGGGGTLANLGVLLTQLQYTRDAEREADATGLELLRKASIAPAGVIDFFQRMEAAEKDKGSATFDILRSHPRSADRAREAAKGPPYPSTPALTAEQWQALRGICQTTAN